jgi:hypothetical protein
MLLLLLLGYLLLWNDWNAEFAFAHQLLSSGSSLTQFGGSQLLHVELLTLLEQLLSLMFEL